MRPPPVNELVGALARALEPLAEVKAAYLFGSHASGRARPDSDIDVAVLLGAVPAPDEKKAKLGQLIEALSRELSAAVLDLVILDDVSPKLAFHVLKHGRVVFERDPVLVHRFRVRTYDLHADYAPVERWFRAVTKERVRQVLDG